MLLSITNHTQPAADLGFLLHKNPDRLQSFALSYGTGHVFYSASSVEICTAVLLLEINPVDELKGRRKHQGRVIDEYVNDRPYVCSSFMSTALAKIYGTAMSGRSKERPDLVTQALDLEVHLTVLPCRGGEDLLRRLFEPLGYRLKVTRHALDPAFPAWGDSPYYSVQLRGTKCLRDLLRHLYVLIPVLDQKKHYYIGPDEVDKLVHKGKEWLPDHPEIELITHRYLRNQRSLARLAMAQLLADEQPDNENKEVQADRAEQGAERKLGLNELRMNTVLEVLKKQGVQTIADLGCGEGKLLRLLLKEKSFAKIVGMDVSLRCLENAEQRLKLDRLPDRQRQRITLLQGSLMYKDKRISGFDAVTIIEVIEHLEMDRVQQLERVVFECARPRLVVLTTPNIEFNQRFENLAAGKLRHTDHRFEWTRQEFQDWAKSIVARFSYTVSFHAIGEEDPELGSPTQMAVFSL